MTAELSSPQAEQSVIGTLLSQPTRTGEVVTELTADHFDGAAPRLLYEAIHRAFYAGTPIEPIAIATPLAHSLGALWSLSEIGAVERVRKLADSQSLSDTPLREHGALIRRYAERRALIRLANGVIAEVEKDELDPGAIAGTISQKALGIASNTVIASEIVDFGQAGRQFIRTLSFEQEAARQGIDLGVRMHIRGIDEFTRGMRPGRLYMTAGEPGVGKALALDTPLPTPTGWTTMGVVQPGDRLLDERGWACEVEAVSEVQHDRPCYRVWFSDGASIIADAEHLWMVGTRRGYMHAWRRGDAAATKAELATTLDLYEGQAECGGRSTHSVGTTEPLALRERPLLVDPYVLGVWLGDGTSASGRITIGDTDVKELRGRMLDRGYASRRADGISYVLPALGKQLGALGLLGEKRIPASYLRASFEQRLDLMRGLVDSDGHVSRAGRVEIAVVNGDLARDIHELAITLGTKATLTVDRARLNGRVIGDRFRVRFMTGLAVATLARKYERLCIGLARGSHRRRFVVKVDRVESVPVKCVRVSSPSHLFLAGEAMIPTHNSAVWWIGALNFATAQAKKDPDLRIGTLILSMEMGDQDSSGRFAQHLARLDGETIQDANVSQAEMQRIVYEWATRKDIPLYLNYAPSLKCSQMLALIAEAIRRYNVGFVIVDHFRTFDLDRRLDNKVDEDEEKARFLKEQIARAMNVAVVCIAHTRKPNSDYNSGRPHMADLRGSGQISAHADVVCFLYRPIMYADQKTIDAGAVMETDAEVIFRKNRQGPSGTGKLYFDPSKMNIH